MKYLISAYTDYSNLQLNRYIKQCFFKSRYEIESVVCTG